MTLNDLISKLTGVKHRGRRFTADCPLHPSDPDSLTVRSEFGSIELECSKGCPDHEIVRALDLKMGDLLDDDDNSITGGLSPEQDDDAEEETPAEEVIKPPIAYDAHGPVRTNAFDTMPAKRWLTESAARPMPRRLFGPFWLEGEISILFADTGKGKSVLAVQIAESLASGVALAPFELDTPGQKVLYFDFELSEKMFEARYSVPSRDPGGPTTDHYPFHDNFIRAQLNGDPDTGFYDTWGEYLQASFEELFQSTAARLVIIDNITYLGTTSKEQSGGALRVMRVLHQLRHEYGLSILVIAHTPKRRFSQGITVNDLQGSKMLSNFADNVFAIGESCLGPNVRYLKHIKPRNSALIHGAGNVCSYRIEKETNFLCFEFTGFSHEREHLEILSINDEAGRRMLISRVKELAELGMSLRQISKELGIAKTTVSKFLRY
jgi:hypothetical protein